MPNATKSAAGRKRKFQRAQKFTVAQLLAGIMGKRRQIKYLWVHADDVGYGASGAPVIREEVVGQTIRPPRGCVSIRIFRATSDRVRVIAVAGLKPHGLKHFQDDKRKNGEYWLPDCHRLNLSIGQPMRNSYPKNLKQVVPGKFARFVRSVKQPAINTDQQLVNRYAPLIQKRGGIPMLYLGDFGLIGRQEFEVVPQGRSF